MRVLLFLLCAISILVTAAMADDQWVYIGTYTKGESEGVYVAPFNSASGKIGKRRLVAELENPSFLAIHPGGTTLFTVSEVADFEGGGAVQAFSIDPGTGDLKLINRRPSKGGAPYLYSSNRGHDSIAVFRIDQGDGTLTQIQVEPIRGEVPRNFNIDKTGKFLLAAGQKSDSVSVFKIDPESGRLEFSGQTLAVPSPVCIKFLKRKTP